MRILHAIHDFLPRHRAGSEIYAFELCRELGKAHHVTVLCADYDPSRPHGHVTWRVHDGLPVVELANNWLCGSFEDTYRPPVVNDRIAHVLQAVQPDVIHVHNLLTLSFDLPVFAEQHGIPVVATLHDYSLVCPAGGQRLHRSEEHSCEVIDTERCVRCFRESPLQAQISFGRVTALTGASGSLHRAVSATLRRFPRLAAQAEQAVRRAPAMNLSVESIERRLSAARRLFDLIDLFVAPSRSMAAEFQRLGLDEAKIRISDYGFTPLGPVSHNGNGTAPGPLRIGFVGTLVWHKGAHVLLEAVRGLASGSYEVRIFGDTGLFPDYAAGLQAQAAGLPVRFMGGFDHARRADVYKQMDVLVVPSIWLENSPLVIHEAFMAGVPVVGARIGGIAELVDDGRTGLLYTPTSSPDLAAALRLLGEKREALAALRSEVRSKPRVKSIEDDAREWEQAYAEVLGRRAAAPFAT
jgi:glycosyltransferase involved in cell wall biosynthesis